VHASARGRGRDDTPTSPPRPTHTVPTPFAAAILMMIWIASRVQKRPSPDTTSVAPATSAAGSTSKIDCTKLCRLAEGGGARVREKGAAGGRAGRRRSATH
jgi:hypothetical protein